jgi:hypothetical protein
MATFIKEFLSRVIVVGTWEDIERRYTSWTAVQAVGWGIQGPK